MKIPSIEKAEIFLSEAEGMNPGPWVQHSRFAANGARIIASYHPRLDTDVAYVLGLLHDIGRREGITHMRHLIDGYSFLHRHGYEDAARISITHSFPVANLGAYVGERDCSQEEQNFIEDYITSTEPTDYDRLIQLCDTIALATGFCLIEKRLVDVAMRLGINEQTLPSWEARFQIKEEIEDTIETSIYQILPGIIEGTFGDILHHAS